MTTEAETCLKFCRAMSDFRGNMVLTFDTNDKGAIVLEHMQELGGLAYFEALNRRKADKVYAAIQAGEERGVFQGKVQTGSLSWMNVVFNVLGDGAEARFLAGVEKAGMKGLKGHR